MISRQEAKARGRATTASEQLRRMLEDSLRLDDAVERLERLEHATDMLLRTLDHEVGRRSLSFPLKLQMETVEQLLDAR
jgi:phage shock protein A